MNENYLHITNSCNALPAIYSSQPSYIYIAYAQRMSSIHAGCSLICLYVCMPDRAFSLDAYGIRVCTYKIPIDISATMLYITYIDRDCTLIHEIDCSLGFIPNK